MNEKSYAVTCYPLVSHNTDKCTQFSDGDFHPIQTFCSPTRSRSIPTVQPILHLGTRSPLQTLPKVSTRSEGKQKKIVKTLSVFSETLSVRPHKGNRSPYSTRIRPALPAGRQGQVLRQRFGLSYSQHGREPARERPGEALPRPPKGGLAGSSIFPVRDRWSYNTGTPR